MKTLSNHKAESLLWWARQYRAVLAEQVANPATCPDTAPRQLEAITKLIDGCAAELGHGDPEPAGMRNKLGNVD